MSRDQDFSSKLAFGVDGEHWLGSLLMGRGSVIMPVYQYTNHDKAPVVLWKANGVDVSRVMPDFVVWKDKRNWFAEAKRKTRWVDGDRHVHAGRGLETGFNLRHWDAYCDIQKETGAPVRVFFLHEGQEPTGVYTATLDELRPHIRPWDGLNKYTGQRVGPPEALFPISCLRRIGDFVGISVAA